MPGLRIPRPSFTHLNHMTYYKKPYTFYCQKRHRSPMGAYLCLANKHDQEMEVYRYPLTASHYVQLLPHEQQVLEDVAAGVQRKEHLMMLTKLTINGHFSTRNIPGRIREAVKRGIFQCARQMGTFHLQETLPSPVAGYSLMDVELYDKYRLVLDRLQETLTRQKHLLLNQSVDYHGARTVTAAELECLEGYSFYLHIRPVGEADLPLYPVQDWKNTGLAWATNGLLSKQPKEKGSVKWTSPDSSLASSETGSS